MEPWLLDLLKVVAVPALAFPAAWGAMRMQMRTVLRDVEKLKQDVVLLPGAYQVNGLSADLRALATEVRALPEHVERRVQAAQDRVDAKANAAHGRIDVLERVDLKQLTERLTRLEERAEAHEQANTKALADLTKANADLNQTVKDIKAELQDAIKDIGDKLDALLLGGLPSRTVRMPAKGGR